ncbi:MAG: polysaccharide biosynthesis tyrosine autokinase [Gemmatimonadales bacterium]|jgi:capsular exopolysaccharide synthesis family protein
MSDQVPAGPGGRGERPITQSAREASRFVFAPQPEAFEKDEIDLRDIWRRLKRRRRTMLTTLLAVLLLAVGWTLWTTPVWSGDALIRVEDQESGLLAAPAALTALTGLGGTGSQIETELRILRTRPIAEDVVARLNLNFVVTDPREVPRDVLFTSLDFGRETVQGEFRIRSLGDGRYRVESTDDETPATSVEFAAGDRVEIPGGSFVLADLTAGSEDDDVELPTSIEFVTLPFQRAVKNLQEDLGATRPDPEANVLQVGYETTDRTLAWKVPNAVAATFIERRKVSNKMEEASTVQFLRAEVDTTQAQLQAVEDSLRQFQESQQVVAVEAQATSEIEQLGALQSKRTELDAERSALSRVLAEIEDGDGRPDYRRLASFPTFFQNQAVATMLSSLVQADSARSALLARLTPNHPDVVEVEERIDELEGQLGAIGRNYLRSVDQQITALDEELDQSGARLEDVPQQQITYARIQRQVEMLGELYKTMRTRLKEAEVQEAIDDSSVRIVEDAIEPLEPVSPRPVRNVALGLVLGAMLGVVLALAREYTDRRLHVTDDLEMDFGLATMARIPGAPAPRRERAPRLITLEDAQSVSAESYRTLRTNVGLMRRDRGGNALLVTSPSTAEEKSATAGNLAVTLARAGSRTVLVDGDMRRPAQHAPFGLERVPGLSDYLLGDESLEAVVRPTSVEALFVLPAGREVANPAELLDDPGMGALLRELRGRFDAIVIDTPPVLAVTDAAILAPDTDGVVLVLRAEKTDRDAIALAIRQLRQVDAEVLGAVVTDADAESSFQASYAEYFGREEPSGLGALIARLRKVFS